jgi:hypothetical protein
LISGHTVASEIADGRLAVLQVNGLPICRNWLVVRMSRRVLTPAADNLWRFVVAEAERQLPELDLRETVCN